MEKHGCGEHNNEPYILVYVILKNPFNNRNVPDNFLHREFKYSYKYCYECNICTLANYDELQNILFKGTIQIIHNTENQNIEVSEYMPFQNYEDTFTSCNVNSFGSDTYDTCLKSFTINPIFDITLRVCFCDNCTGINNSYVKPAIN